MFFDMGKKKYKKELIEALFDNDIKKVCALVKKGIDVDLMIAEKRVDANAQGIDVFIQRINLNLVIVEKGKGYDTPLHQAIEFNYVDIVKILLEGGADENLKDNIGRTPLHHAVGSHHLKCVQVLLDHNVNLDVRESNKSYYTGDTELGNTALITAAMYGYVDITELLLNKGANVNGIGSNGLTPLIAASITGKYTVIKTLLKRNADINIQLDNGSSAISLAEEKGHGEIVQLLTK